MGMFGTSWFEDGCGCSCPPPPTKIYVIKSLWVDPLENHNAYGYETVGCVLSEAEAKRICGAFPDYIGTGWPVLKGETLPRRKYVEIDVIKEGQMK